MNQGSGLTSVFKSLDVIIACRSGMPSSSSSLLPVSIDSSTGRSNSAKMALASSSVRSADVVRWNVRVVGSSLERTSDVDDGLRVDDEFQ